MKSSNSLRSNSINAYFGVHKEFWAAILQTDLVLPVELVAACNL